MTQKNILIVGCGNMGFAMLKGWVDQNAIAASDVKVVEPNEALRARVETLGIKTAVSHEAFSDAPFTLIMIAVKPQMLELVLPDYQAFCAQGATILTVAAGAPIALYQRILGAETPVIRVMPNTPAAIGKGMIATFASPQVTDAVQNFAHHLLSANGVVEQLDDEAMMDAVTAVSGSGPAYLFHFIECLTEAAKAAGLPDDKALIFARQTIFGAASLAEASEDSATILRQNVTSPKGTTEAALKVFMDDGALEKLVTKAVAASKARSIELRLA